MANLATLPVELLTEIYKYAGSEHLTGGLSQTCSKLRQVSMDGRLWEENCYNLFPFMCYNSRQINAVENYREFYFTERQACETVKRILDLLVYGPENGSNDQPSTNPPPNIIYELYNLIREICDLNEFALPTLHKISYNPFMSLSHTYYAQICLKLIVRIKGLLQLMDIAEYLANSADGNPNQYKPIDFVLGMYWLRHGLLDPKGMERLYGPSSLIGITRYVNKHRKSPSTIDTLTELNNWLSDTVEEINPKLYTYFKYDREAYPCLVCAEYAQISERLGLKPSVLAVPYWSFVVFQPEEFVPLNTSSEDDERLPYPTHLSISETVSKESLLAVDAARRYRIRHIDEVPYLSKIALENLYPDSKNGFINLIKCFFVSFLSGTGNDNSDPAIKLLWFFFSNLFRDFHEMPLANAKDILSKDYVFDSIILEKYFERETLRSTTTATTAKTIYHTIPSLISDHLKQAEIQVNTRQPTEVDPIKFQIGDIVQRSTDSEPLMIIEWHKEHPKYPDTMPYYRVITQRGRKNLIPQKNLEKISYNLHHSAFYDLPAIGEYFLGGMNLQLSRAHCYAYPGL